MDNQPTPIRPLLLRIPEAAAELGVCQATIYNMIHAGQIPHIVIRSKYRIPKAALEAMIATQTREAQVAS